MVTDVPLHRAKLHTGQVASASRLSQAATFVGRAHRSPRARVFTLT